MRVQQIRLGLWRWTGLHPELGEEVGSVYYEAPENVVVVDPLVPPEATEEFWRALDDDVELVGLPVRILLTSERHGRSADEIAARYGAEVGGDAPPGVEVFPVEAYGESAIWIPEHGALVVGDLLHGSPLARRPGIDAGPLQFLLDLPVDVVLPSHGEAVLDDARSTLREALAA